MAIINGACFIAVDGTNDPGYLKITVRESKASFGVELLKNLYRAVNIDFI